MLVVIFRAPCLYSFIERARVTVRSVVLFSVRRSGCIRVWRNLACRSLHPSPPRFHESRANVDAAVRSRAAEAARARCSAPITSICGRRSSSRILLPFGGERDRVNYVEVSQSRIRRAVISLRSPGTHSMTPESRLHGRRVKGV